jgi:hypothetical protein
MFSFFKNEVKHDAGLKEILKQKSVFKSNHATGPFRQSKLTIAAWSIFFGGFFYWAINFMRDSQIKKTPLFKGIMFTIRHDHNVRRYIGDKIGEAENLSGFLNHIKGRANLSFDVSGDMGKGNVHVEAYRPKRNDDYWDVKKLVVVVAGEEIVKIDEEPNNMATL